MPNEVSAERLLAIQHERLTKAQVDIVAFKARLELVERQLIAEKQAREELSRKMVLVERELHYALRT